MNDNLSLESALLAFKRDHWSCLLYLESRAVDHRGVPDRRQMNDDDWSAVEDFVESGLVQWCGTGTNPVLVLTDSGWSVASALRRARAEAAQAGTAASYMDAAIHAVRGIR